MYNRPIEKVGSDNRLYQIEQERITPDRIELSLVVTKKQLQINDYRQHNVDIHTKLVEQYIESIKYKYEPSKRRLHRLAQELRYTTINNHFDYLQLLHRVQPILEELMQ